MDPVELGLECRSDTAHLSLLGYNPCIYYRGRNAFESLSAGLAMVPGNIAVKVSSFGTFRGCSTRDGCPKWTSGNAFSVEENLPHY